uniref:Uncharacterized protein n=1 Tax=Strongyloides papillosus TaxID=174720 RepID=A0A0N5BGJ6_STREA
MINFLFRYVIILTFIFGLLYEIDAKKPVSRSDIILENPREALSNKETRKPSKSPKKKKPNGSKTTTTQTTKKSKKTQKPSTTSKLTSTTKRPTQKVTKPKKTTKTTLTTTTTIPTITVTEPQEYLEVETFDPCNDRFLEL